MRKHDRSKYNILAAALAFWKWEADVGRNPDSICKDPTTTKPLLNVK